MVEQQILDDFLNSMTDKDFGNDIKCLLFNDSNDEKSIKILNFSNEIYPAILNGENVNDKINLFLNEYDNDDEKNVIINRIFNMLNHITIYNHICK